MPRGACYHATTGQASRHAAPLAYPLHARTRTQCANTRTRAGARACTRATQRGLLMHSVASWSACVRACTCACTYSCTPIRTPTCMHARADKRAGCLRECWRWERRPCALDSADHRPEITRRRIGGGAGRLAARDQLRRVYKHPVSLVKRASRRERASDSARATKKSEYGCAARAANTPRSPSHPRPPLPHRSCPPLSSELVAHHRPPLLEPLLCRRLLLSSTRRHRELPPV